MKKDIISDDDLEANEEELKRVAYTAISFLAFLVVLTGATFYLLS